MQHVEIERKYDVGPGFVTPGAIPPYTLDQSTMTILTSEYFDTLDLRLLAAGCALRRRVGGLDDGWHVKLPADGDARVELHAPLTDPTTMDVPLTLREALADIVEYEPFVPVARLVTRRVERSIRRDGSVVALLADDAVTATSADSLDVWREVEAELVDPGTSDDLDRIDQALIEAGAVPSASGSKVARALAGFTPVPPPATLSGAIRAYAIHQVGAIQGHEGGARTDRHDGIHKMRVATRRLRSTLRTFGPLFDGSWNEPLRDELRWLAGALGAARDAEVLRDRIVDHLGGRRGAASSAPVVEALTESFESAHRSLVVALDSDRASRLRAALVGLVVTLARSGEPDSADALVHQRIRRTRHRVEQALAEALDDDVDEVERAARYHEVRKRAKEARYAHEAIVHGAMSDGDQNRARQQATRWEAVTEALGALQDANVAANRLADLRLDLPGQSAGVVDALIEREEAEQATATAAAHDALDEVRR